MPVAALLALLLPFLLQTTPVETTSVAGVLLPWMLA